MFILRRITSENKEVNRVLGESYNLITEERNKEDFDTIHDPDQKEIFGYISHKDGSEIIPLFKKSLYFVMMSNGQTFANITHYEQHEGKG